MLNGNPSLLVCLHTCLYVYSKWVKYTTAMGCLDTHGMGLATHMGLCVNTWGCVYILGVVCTHVWLFVYTWGCVYTHGVVWIGLVWLCVHTLGCRHRRPWLGCMEKNTCSCCVHKHAGLSSTFENPQFFTKNTKNHQRRGDWRKRPSI